MTDFGVQPTGYVRKPLATILAELESEMITEFGPGVIQTSQSPFGQLNGLIADLIAEIDEINLDIYQSYDPNQAEGTRLDILARTRLMTRNLNTDEEFRRMITNEGRSRIDIQDLQNAVAGVAGVTFAKVFVDDVGSDVHGLDAGAVAIAAMGGADDEISDAIRNHIAPGINTYGNTRIDSLFEGQCRSFSIIRPAVVPVGLTIKTSVVNTQESCPAPSPFEVRSSVASQWANMRLNGLNVSFYEIRKIVERTFSNVEVLSVVGERNGDVYVMNETVPIDFFEISEIDVDAITVNFE